MKFYCRHCGQPIKASADLAGANINCPSCNEAMPALSFRELYPVKPVEIFGIFNSWSLTPCELKLGVEGASHYPPEESPD